MDIFNAVTMARLRGVVKDYEHRMERASEIEAALKELVGLAILPDYADSFTLWPAAVERGRKALDRKL